MPVDPFTGWAGGELVDRVHGRGVLEVGGSALVWWARDGVVTYSDDCFYDRESPWVVWFRSRRGHDCCVVWIVFVEGGGNS